MAEYDRDRDKIRLVYADGEPVLTLTSANKIGDITGHIKDGTAYGAVDDPIAVSGEVETYRIQIWFQ